MRPFGLLCLLLIPFAPLAFELNDEGKLYVEDLKVYEDTTNRYTIEDILPLPVEKWVPNEGHGLNLGYQTSTVWIKFSITNPYDHPVERILDVNYPLLDYINLYIKDESNVKTVMTSGDSLPFNSRNIRHPNFVNKILITEQKSLDIIISIRSNAPIQTEFILWKFDDFQNHYRTVASANFFYLGIILSAAAFNLFVFLFIREAVYLVYGLYATFFALFITSQNAIIFEYLAPNSPLLHNWSQLMFACLTVSLTALFNYYFLKFDIRNLTSKALILFTVTPLVILAASPITTFPIAIQLIVLTALITIPICFIIGIANANQSSDRSMYLLAWSWLFCGVFIFLMAKVGIIPFNIYTNNAIQAGSALELLTFAIALARRIHREKETRIHAQQILIEGSKHSAQLQKELLYRATHHAVTGLPNKSYFENWLDDEIKSKPNGLLSLIQLSRIAEIEKTLGTEFAEEALEKFSVRLNSLIKKVSGIQIIDPLEEFAIATIDSSTHSFFIHPAHADLFIKEMEALIDELNAPLSISNMEIDPYIRVAYVEQNSTNENASHLVRQGGIALEHTASSQIINHYRKDKDHYNERRLLLMRELKEAIKDNGLSLDFQPLIDTQSGKYLGAEALIRWPHKNHGLIMPDQFIDVAEQTGVIQSLSLWVLKNAIQTLKTWGKLKPDFLLSINISAYNLQDKKFMDAVHFIIHEENKLCKNIILEITESQMMTDTQAALENLWKLSEVGFHIAIDDFGTGYSNLAYLKQLPASELKIDKSFILNLESDKQNQVLVHTAIEMAHNLGLKVVAEGVESEKSRIVLQEMGCDMCQGFHISRPVNKEQFETLLKAHG